MFNLSFVLTFLAIFIVAVLVGNYIAIDGDELSKSKKIYYKTISIISVFVFWEVLLLFYF